MAGRLARLAGLVDPADGLIVIGVAGAIDGRQVVERRRPRRILGERPCRVIVVSDPADKPAPIPTEALAEVTQ